MQIKFQYILSERLWAGQPRHKIIYITGHWNKTLVNNYDEINDEVIGELCPIS